VFVLLIALPYLRQAYSTFSRIPENKNAGIESPAAKSDAEWPLTKFDALGREVTLAKPPERIVSLSPAITETVFALGAGGRLVGRSDFCNYPPEVAYIKSIGGLLNPSLEDIVLLQPDLVFVQKVSPREIVERLGEAGVAVFAVDEATSLNGVLETIRIIGIMCASRDNAIRLEFEKSALMAEYKSRRRAHAWRVYFGGVEAPYYTAGEGTFIDDLISLAGARNIASGEGRERKSSQGWPQLSPEEIASADPEVILVGHSPLVAGKDATDSILSAARKNPAFRNTSAVKYGRICVIDQDELLRPGPRIFNALEKFSAYLDGLEDVE
jgi:iron complex transport system substrate-binding protein